MTVVISNYDKKLVQKSQILLRFTKNVNKMGYFYKKIKISAKILSYIFITKLTFCHKSYILIVVNLYIMREEGVFVTLFPKGINYVL